MGATFGDITLYNPTPYEIGTSEYIEELSLINFICDLYVQKMYGYKPPQATRVTLQPAYYGVWDRTWKTGSLFSIAPEFDRKKFDYLNKTEKKQYVLDTVHFSMLQLGEEYKWDNKVFEKAYNEILECNFSFLINYPAKLSRDKKKQGRLIIEKTETITTAHVVILKEGQEKKRTLITKQNWYWYDSIYLLAKHYKWIDNDKFGINMKNVNFAVWYSISVNKVLFEVEGEIKEDYDLKEKFLL